MGRKLEKRKRGEALEYYSRKQALRYLQIGLPNFIRLCQWKDIHPTQPNNLKVVSNGDGKERMYYKRKDIISLIHEPIVNTLREMRAHHQKVRKARERKDQDKVFRLQKKKPRYTLDGVFKSLYPTPEDALRNITDCLKTIFIFATLPKMTQFNPGLIVLSRRLKLEFMNYCISQQALRRGFLGATRYSFGAEIHGIAVNWDVPLQNVGMCAPAGVDYRFMASQAEFDCTMLMAVLRNLYTDAGLAYPPVFKCSGDMSEWTEKEMLESLAFPLASTETDIEERLEQLDKFRDMDEDVAAAAESEARVAAIQGLFRGKKVFLNREVPREIFCFVLRCCGATEVSWDSTAAGGGATFSESDEGINYHVIDRPSVSSHVSRFYVQPQYVFDSMNAARLLPVKDYMPGMKLIPHLSPFVDNTKGYVPPELGYLKGEIDADALYIPDDDGEDEEGEDAAEERAYESEDDNDDEDDDEDDDEEEIEEMEVEEEEEVVEKVEVKKKDNRKQKKNRKSKEELNKEIEAKKEIKLQEMSLPKKRLNLYNKMKHAEKKEKSTVENLKQKRQAVNKKRRLSKQ